MSAVSFEVVLATGLVLFVGMQALLTLFMRRERQAVESEGVES